MCQPPARYPVRQRHELAAPAHDVGVLRLRGGRASPSAGVSAKGSRALATKTSCPKRATHKTATATHKTASPKRAKRRMVGDHCGADAEQDAEQDARAHEHAIRKDAINEDAIRKELMSVFGDMKDIEAAGQLYLDDAPVHGGCMLPATSDVSDAEVQLRSKSWSSRCAGTNNQRPTGTKHQTPTTSRRSARCRGQVCSATTHATTHVQRQLKPTLKPTKPRLQTRGPETTALLLQHMSQHMSLQHMSLLRPLNGSSRAMMMMMLILMLMRSTAQQAQEAQEAWTRKTYGSTRKTDGRTRKTGRAVHTPNTG